MEAKGRNKILIVDDEIKWHEILAAELAGFGFQTINARDGEEGIQMAISERPDLILLDIVMPKMDGLTMMRKLRQDSWGRSVPIVLFTSLKPNEEIMKRVSIDKPAFYLVKTEYKPSVVASKIMEIFNA